MVGGGAERSLVGAPTLLLPNLPMATSRSPSCRSRAGYSRWMVSRNTDGLQPPVSLVPNATLAMEERELLRPDDHLCVAAGAVARDSAQPVVAGGLATFHPAALRLGRRRPSTRPHPAAKVSTRLSTLLAAATAFSKKEWPWNARAGRPREMVPLLSPCDQTKSKATKTNSLTSV